MLELIIACVASYLIGSIPNGLILGKAVWGVDLREHGSGNIGATNAWRTIGKPAGICIFVLDMLKGFLGAGLGLFYAGAPEYGVLCGILAVVGHSWSIFLKFKGGKSVSTGLGVLIMLMPIIAVIVFLVWLAIVFVTRYVSLGSIVGAAMVPVLSYIFDMPMVYTGFGALAAVFIIYRHKSNIERLLNGTESKIKAAK
ncbi:Acyl-phosphate:glycerol-3-phosphate O-acyltransferase PlsY [Anaerovibrio sp. JC8]|uniref:glycerol-3-phosphate 1-O-acyltransferase PlsY n=1 Tax=Anaerovibrio sp. JC8 TaxID=1240085 RepID=UPI000A0EC46C|nr:glycerol-3-phosphate 1-O-acyltransferase PlsY [Anaerovibrio sp. JC8]ORU00284.1 Acyl-phosphate:glycerol-3-phosphate O-acyltransferase PlsY [Anaerovibrio sp. JC8]